LHYEFRIAGVHQDPLKVELPQGNPLAEKFMADFSPYAYKQLALLQSHKNMKLVAV